MPYSFQGVPLYFNDTNLSVVNNLAKSALGGELTCDMHKVRLLPLDNGERFFSDYLKEQKDRNKRFGKNFKAGEGCKCEECLPSFVLATKESTVEELLWCRYFNQHQYLLR